MNNGNNFEDKRELLEIYALQHIGSSINYAYGIYLVVLQAALGRLQNGETITKGPYPFQAQKDHLNRLVRGSDKNCHDQLRMNGYTFMRLCCLVRNVGLVDSK